MDVRYDIIEHSGEAADSPHIGFLFSLALNYDREDMALATIARAIFMSDGGHDKGFLAKNTAKAKFDLKTISRHFTSCLSVSDPNNDKKK
jgi:hypothetical protein